MAVRPPVQRLPQRRGEGLSIQGGGAHGTTGAYTDAMRHHLCECVR